jgi:hypothetical protein
VKPNEAVGVGDLLIQIHNALGAATKTLVLLVEDEDGLVALGTSATGPISVEDGRLQQLMIDALVGMSRNNPQSNFEAKYSADGTKTVLKGE